MASAGPSHIEPKILTEALAGLLGAQWEKVRQSEYQSLLENKVFKVVPESEIPAGTKPITSKAVLTIKFNVNGDIECLKVHLVARGFLQREGMDYQEVFAPVANIKSICILLTLVAHYNLKLDQMDVCTAFLSGDLDRGIYMIPPNGFNCPHGCIWKLECLIYGLKQASHVWNI